MTHQRSGCFWICFLSLAHDPLHIGVGPAHFVVLGTQRFQLLVEISHTLIAIPDHHLLHFLEHVNVFQRGFPWPFAREVLAQYTFAFVQRDELLACLHYQIGDNARLL